MSHRIITPSRSTLSRFITPQSPFNGLLTSCFYKTLNDHDSVNAVMTHLPNFEFGMLTEYCMRDHFNLNPSDNVKYDALKCIYANGVIYPCKFEIKGTRTFQFVNINTHNRFDVLMCARWVKNVPKMSPKTSSNVSLNMSGGQSGYIVYMLTRNLLVHEMGTSRFNLSVKDVEQLGERVSTQEHVDIILDEWVKKT